MLNRPAAVFSPVLILAALASATVPAAAQQPDTVGPGPAGAQQPDTSWCARRALERLLLRDARLRLAIRGRGILGGTIRRLTADSVYVQTSDWPVGASLATVDTVWEHVPSRDRGMKTGWTVGGLAGAVLGGLLGSAMCGLSDSSDNHCTRGVLFLAGGGAALFGSIGGIIGAVGGPGPTWEVRYP